MFSFFFSSRRRHTICGRDWSSDVCSSDLEDVEGMRRRAGQPVRWLDTREEAAARYLRSVGLDGVADPAAPLVASGIAEGDRRWRLAFDPAANGVGQPDMARSLA